MKSDLLSVGYREVRPEKRGKFSEWSRSIPFSNKAAEEEEEFIKYILSGQFGRQPTEEEVKAVERIAVPGLTNGYYLAYMKVLFGTMIRTEPIKTYTISKPSGYWVFYWYKLLTDTELKR
jgi:hypothetical protein